MDSLQLGACSYGSVGAQGGTSGHSQHGVLSRRYSEQGVAKVQGTCRIVPTPELERVGRHSLPKSQLPFSDGSRPSSILAKHPYRAKFDTSMEDLGCYWKVRIPVGGPSSGSALVFSATPIRADAL